MQMQVLSLKRSEADRSNDAKYVCVSCKGSLYKLIQNTPKRYIVGEFIQGGVVSYLCMQKVNQFCVKQCCIQSPVE